MPWAQEVGEHSALPRHRGWRRTGDLRADRDTGPPPARSRHARVRVPWWSPAQPSGGAPQQFCGQSRVARLRVGFRWGRRPAQQHEGIDAEQFDMSLAAGITPKAERKFPYDGSHLHRRTATPRFNHVPRVNGHAAQISIFEPNSTTALLGSPRKSAAPLALWCICAYSFSRQGALPLPMVGTTTSRERK
jgi:hypothetical protein